MRFIKSSWCLLVWMLFFMYSCSPHKKLVVKNEPVESDIFIFYQAKSYIDNYSLILNEEYRSYLFYVGGTAFYGKYKTACDTVFLYPKFEMFDKSFKEYNCFLSGYYNNNKEDICIEELVFVKDGDVLYDKTLEYYYPCCKSCGSFNCFVPMKKVALPYLEVSPYPRGLE